VSAHEVNADLDHDVAIVGYGPVGQTLAALLGQAGHHVVAFDRYPTAYLLPRAIRFDHELMRIFQGIGAVPHIEHDITTADHYLWYGAQGQLILDIDNRAPSPSGWARDYVFYQPTLEDALDESARTFPTVSVQRGWEVVGLGQSADHAELQLREHGAKGPIDGGPTRTVRARYVIGADGANSFVRNALGIDREDLGFCEEWFVVDVRPHDMADVAHLPIAAQYCDPKRPHVAVLTGPRHRRWEFMLLPGDDLHEFRTSPAKAWELLAPYITPDQGTLVRQAVYEFRSRLTNTLRSGRFLLAGDAAKQMPPFMAEGMCSGVRDAANLAWRLNLALQGLIGEAALDSYTTERQGQNRATVTVSLQMGKVSCTLDPEAAAARDAAFLAGAVPPPVPVPPLGAGVLHAPGLDPIAGRISVQGRIETSDGQGLSDDLAGPGFRLVCAQGDAVATLGPHRMAFLHQLRAAVVALDPSVPGAAKDLDGSLTSWLGDNGLVAALSRPDFYAFGGARSLAELPALVDDLQAQLGSPQSGTAA
jgi:2-polyprenyl-6-methoxyphenol hydroxylase-like FAD-dependent oxidoreductase